MPDTVLILGSSGRIGRHSAAAFARAGWLVRRYTRGTDMREAAKGCAVIVNGLNPPNYHNWAGLLPRITADVIAAAKASGATVVLPGNVYHFGDTPGTWSECTPPRPVARKGDLRLEMERTYAACGFQTIILRAGNFIDPDRQGCMWTELYLRKPGTLTLPGPERTRQAFCYLPDWARAAVALAELRTQLDPFEDIPFPGHTLSAGDIAAAVEAVTGRPLRRSSFPWWAMRLASPVWEMARELTEMRYLWRTDHALCAKRLSALLPGFAVTPLDEVVAAYLHTAPDGQASHVAVAP
ncbi:MAG: epimerase [Pseudomonadota bacterium]